LAFYDALDVNDSDDTLKDEILREIAIDLISIVRINITIDWTVKENVRAKLRAPIKRLLRKMVIPQKTRKSYTNNFRTS
jgi:type I restriction enzyme, R subunit